MKFLWLIDKDNDIYKVSEDYSYWTIYYKNGNYITNYTWKITKNKFNFYKKWMNFKEISEGDAILEML